MTKRPISFTLLSIFYAAMTVMAITYVTLTKDLPINWSFAVFLTSLKPPYIIYHWLLPLCITMSIIKMRKYSYYAFMVAQVLMLAIPFMAKNLIIPELSQETTFITYLLQLCSFLSIAYFTQKSIRNLYFDSSKRTWDWATRHHVSLPFSLKVRHSQMIIDCQTIDMSTSGLLFTISGNHGDLEKQTKITANLSLGENEISIPIQIVRTINKDGQTLYGAQFHHRHLWQFVQIRNLLNDAKSIKYSDYTSDKKAA
ncbi:PilZ domain-containing protein [Bacteriovorax sp. Seq25_V]|uniref:PilZ domain-containing protein n=1 Tax=Bacteriovorax sp. Seq25_V TaxID=1201288 RepID=UPI000389E2CC|nr:PilZ domain-containing protein [Bacteriovorax sp. Seq25_V]EQC44194.1 type IV pilus assembly protein PilZ [Bacteriovorax sp. Seq25_V]